MIRDLLLYYKPGKVFDPMSGSGTCRDVCQELGIDCWSGDIHKGFDLCAPHHFYGEGRSFEPYGFDFVWIHPPYWRQKLYAADSRDLSRAATLDEFLERYALAIVHCSRMLRKGGKLAVLDMCREVSAVLHLVQCDRETALVSGESAAALVRLTAVDRRTGRTLSLRLAQFATFRDDRLVSLKAIFDSFDAVEQTLGHQIDLSAVA